MRSSVFFRFSGSFAFGSIKYAGGEGWLLRTRRNSAYQGTEDFAPRPLERCINSHKCLGPDLEFQNSLLCGLSGWVESQVEFPTFNERKKTVGFSFEELIRRKWRNLPSKKSPAYNASLG